MMKVDYDKFQAEVCLGAHVLTDIVTHGAKEYLDFGLRQFWGWRGDP